MELTIKLCYFFLFLFCFLSYFKNFTINKVIYLKFSKFETYGGLCVKWRQAITNSGK